MFEHINLAKIYYQDYAQILYMSFDPFRLLFLFQ